MTSGEQVTTSSEQWVVRVDPNRCAASGLCLLIADTVFQRGDTTNKAVVHEGGNEQPNGRVVSGKELELTIEASEDCPCRAISVEPIAPGVAKA